jgi:hypothetical protein
LQFKRLGEERASRSNNTKIQKMKMLGANWSAQSILA